MDSKLVAGALLILVLILAWAPWQSPSDAAFAAISSFNRKNADIADGCGLKCERCGVQSVDKTLFGYQVSLSYLCGFGPQDRPASKSTVFVSFAGTVHG